MTGRSSIVALTERGLAHFGESAAAHHAWIGAMFAGMSRDDQADLYRLLATLKASIGEEARGEGTE